MSSQDFDNETATAYGKPCTGCRKRKVRCDKTRPCSNCMRSKQLCTYESNDGITGIGREGLNVPLPSTDNELRERLARLEKLMESMMVGEQLTTARLGTDRPAAITNHSLTSPPPSNFPSTTTHQHQSSPQHHHSSSTQSAQYSISVLSQGSNAPIGQILFQDGYSAYFDADFWPGLISEVEDLRQLFDDTIVAGNVSSQWMSMSLLGIPHSPFSSTDLHLAYPTLDQSNFLCKQFFECVHPFIRVLHSSLFARELGIYRRGTFHLPNEFEALLFSIYTLTINSLRPEVVERVFSTSKSDLLARFQMSTQLALTRISFQRTERVHGLGALIHYVTFLFQQNLYKDATALLAVASRVAQSMGIHRDSGHFPYSEWVIEIRARLWNQICCLDAAAITSYGAESCLPATADARPPRNANERDWHASRFAKPSSVPQNVLGYTETTFAIVNRETSDLTRLLAMIDGTDVEKRQNVLRQVEASLNQKYLAGIDRSDPSQTVIAALSEVRLSTLKLSIRHREAERVKSHPSDPQRHQLFLSALELLEAIEYHCTNFAPQNWEWIFTTTVPWLATAIAITGQVFAKRQADQDRAKQQVDIVFQRFSHPSPVSSTPMWQVLVRLLQHIQDESVHGGHVQLDATAPGGQVRVAGFADDLMLDFGDQTGGVAPLDYNDPLIIQDMQDLPWYGWLEGSSSTGRGS